jgi:hypothetical protein
MHRVERETERFAEIAIGRGFVSASCGSPAVSQTVSPSHEAFNLVRHNRLRL